MGKYLCDYSPNHKKATKEGYVYTHILQAEKLLNRKLKDLECVHHIDENKYNNDLNNLMVFKSKSDHTSFHRNGNAILEGDVYVCPNKTLNHKKLCPICKTNMMYCNSNMCRECGLKKRNNINIKPSKEKLNELIHTLPFTKIGKMYGVSDNAIRRWCIKYNLPSKRKEIINI